MLELLVRDVYKEGRQYNNKSEYSDAIIAAWESISQIQIQSLYDSLPRRIHALYDVKGKHTKYWWWLLMNKMIFT